MINLSDTILAHLANSPALMQMIESFNEFLDPSANIDAFYNQVWNVLTAQGYGLDVWGRIVGVNRRINLPGTTSFWGFAESAASNLGSFAESDTPARLWDGGSGTEVYNLGDEAFRTLILAKAMANNCNCSCAAINQILSTLFADQGRAYCIDTGNMTMLLALEFDPDPVTLGIIVQTGVIPRPSGVQASIATGLAIGSTLGFNGSGLATLGEGTLFSGTYTIINTGA